MIGQKIEEEQKRIESFAEGLAGEINSGLIAKNYSAKVDVLPLPTNSGFVIYVGCSEKHVSEVMVSRSIFRDHALSVDRAHGVRPVIGSSGLPTISFPEELRAAANVYEEVGYILNRKLGAPASSDHGRDNYLVDLESIVSK